MMTKEISLKDKIKILKLFLDRKIIYLLVLNILFTFVIGVFPSLVANYQLQLFDSVNNSSMSFYGLLNYIIVILIFYIICELTNFFFNKVNFLFAEKIQFSFKNQIYAKMDNLNICFFENAEFYNLLYRIRDNGVTNVIGALTDWFKLVRNSIQVVSLSVVLLQIHWIFPVLTVSFSVPYVFLFQKMNFNHYFNLLNNSKKTRKNHYLIDILTKKEYAKEVRVFGLFDYLYKYHVRLRDELFNETYHLAKKYTIYAGIISISKRFIQVLCLALGIYFIYEDVIGIGQYAILYQTITQIQAALLHTVECYKTQNNQQYHLEDIIEFFYLEEEEKINTKDNFNLMTIELDNVSFTYPFSKNSVLKDINLTIPFGQKIAIVGENGSGKTTLAYLLAGLYLPSNGSIKVGKQNVKEVMLKYREYVGIVFQDFIKFYGTIRDNVEIGSKRKVSSDEVKNALKLAGSWDFVDLLPDGIDTQLGFFESNSVDISGGQWQKLAIARGLLEKEHKILILDECAASLDPFAESFLYKKFHQLTEGKTSISISHRLGVTRLVDRVLVVKDGRIVEDGSHEELMKKHGLYYDMYIAQREIYQ